MAILIAFYSRAGENYFGGAYRRISVGNTEKAAEMLADLTGGELYKIEQAQPYSEDYQTCIAQAKADLQKKARPEVLGLPDDLDAYDEIYLGYPNYWGTMPMAVYTFLENYDFTGKTIHPFCTHEGSGLSRTVQDIQKAAPDAVVTKGLAIHGSRVNSAKPALEKWVRKEMKCEEFRVNLRTVPHSANRQRSAQLLFRLNHTLPFSEEYNDLLRELLGDNLGEGSTIAPPLSGAALDMLKIGKGVFVNSNLLAMARGGITIGDHARIAANVQLISNNHDPYDLDVLTCKPVEIGDYAWIGAGATILPGVCVGRHAVVGAASVVTKDVPDYAVAVGNPAKVIKMLDRERFKEGEA